MIPKTKKFDAVKWVRELRDRNYNDNKNISMAEFASKLSDDARKTDLWRLLVKSKESDKK